jgi:HPt (histidine-containing phosphotransfer) domain-containing protein
VQGVDAGLAALQAVPGLDAARGLAALGGRSALYRRLLGVFVDQHAGDGRQLVRLLGQRRDAEAAALVHHLRGAAATLGLVDVEAAARRLEDALAGAQEGPRQAVRQDVVKALDALLPPLVAALAR